jgi:hypothetical protein
VREGRKTACPLMRWRGMTVTVVILCRICYAAASIEDGPDDRADRRNTLVPEEFREAID